MGLTISSSTPKSKEESLLPHAIAGDIAQIKTLIGRHIASHDAYVYKSTYSSSSQVKQYYNPLIQDYVNYPDDQGNTPLLGAIYGGHLDIVTFLIEKCGANIMTQNNMKCNSIWIAAGYEKDKVLEYLISRITIMVMEKKNESSGNVQQLRNVAGILSQKNNSGDTPFLAAVSKGYLNVVKILFNAMDTIDTEMTTSSDNDSEGKSSIGVVQEYKWRLLSTKNKAGDTPLSVAVGLGSDAMIKYLLDQEENCITSKYVPGGKDDVTNANDDRPLNSKNSHGLTPFMVACERNNVPILEELNKRNATFSQDSNGRSPLAIASFCGCLDAAQYLLSLVENQNNYNGKEVMLMLNQRDRNDCTPLWLAARTGNAKMTKLLIEAGADVSIIGAEKLSVKEVAVKYKKDKVIDYLSKLDNINL